ncbi:anti-sigma regulatory factor (Ser/Thr protein kinase) [Kineococcus radiotolerans]|uniref:Anti-sigma regulatory factor (Ser/Thr protein kinase) n=1 Tax=Kineococcus radiotolerans TaxID=131568 RepID=A0A7W4TNB3_KINRA|nr:ATP-binding protein [Kineococcus radiotolerans]MBB2902075.1 anti-sigma regulatory factor (Ser/Thr protein kinase) [Kineococcus radiotolerans]
MARLELDAHLSSVGTARHWAAGEFLRTGRGGDAAALGVLELLVTETVANAVHHGRGPLRLDLTRDGATGRVRVAVHDGEPRPPVLRTVGPRATGGRGIALVDRLAAAWGTDLEGPAGKTVWFDVAPGPVLAAA